MAEILNLCLGYATKGSRASFESTLPVPIVTVTKLKGEEPASPPKKLQFRAPTWRPVKLQELTNGSR